MASALPNCRTCSFRKLALCGVFLDHAPDEFGKLERRFQRIKARQMIYRAGSLMAELSIIRLGWAVSYRILSDGKRQVFAFHIPGDSAGMRSEEPSPQTMSMQALTDVEMCVFDRREFINRALRHPELSSALIDEMLGLLYPAENALAVIGRTSAESRVSFLVLSIYERLNERGLAESASFPFPVKQDQIADALGLTTAHVNRTLRALRNSGTLSVGKDNVMIQDFERLKSNVVY